MQGPPFNGEGWSLKPQIKKRNAGDEALLNGTFAAFVAEKLVSLCLASMQIEIARNLYYWLLI